MESAGRLSDPPQEVALLVINQQIIEIICRKASVKRSALGANQRQHILVDYQVEMGPRRLSFLAKLANTDSTESEAIMRTISATEAKYELGRLIDMARSAPVVIEKHGRPVVVVVAVEEFERLKRRRAPNVRIPRQSEKRG